MDSCDVSSGPLVDDAIDDLHVGGSVDDFDVISSVEATAF